MKNQTVFISHRTTDKEIADMLLDFLVTTGIPRDCIKCSSLPGNDVMQKISTEVRAWIESSAVNIVILSDDYYKSAYCLNEAGILWYLKDIPVIPIALPEINPTDMIGFLNEDYKLRRLSSDDDIAYVYDIVQESLGVPAAKHAVITDEMTKLKAKYHQYCEKRESNNSKNHFDALDNDDQWSENHFDALDNDDQWFEEEDIYVDGYHEVHDRDGNVIEKGQYVSGNLVDGISYNIILMVSKDKELDEEPEPTDEEAKDFDGCDYDCWKIKHTEDPVAMEDIAKIEWHYDELGRYDLSFISLYSSQYIKGIGLEYFYVVDKKVKLEGKLVKPTFTNFRTLESVMAEREPDELDYIKTGVRKYDEAGCAEIEVDTKQE